MLHSHLLEFCYSDLHQNKITPLTARSLSEIRNYCKRIRRCLSASGILLISTISKLRSSFKLVLLSVASVSFNSVRSSLYMAPVAGSTMRNPISPPNTMLPKYQPLMSELMVTSFERNPGFVYRIVYVAFRK